MKKLNTYILLVLITIFGCGKKKSNHTKKLIVSVLPQKTFVDKIAGKDFEVEVLVPPGASPATYELKPSQMIAISNAAIWFRIGHIGFEKAWEQKITAANSNMQVVDLSVGLDLIESKHSHGNIIHIGTDPHTWLSPKMVKAMSATVCNELIRLNPDKKAQYQVNLTTFLKEIDTTDSIITQTLQNINNRDFIIFHPSLGYLSRDYGLTQHSIEFEGKNPKPANLKNLVDLAREKEIKIVFIQKEFDIENAETIAKEIEGKIVVIDPLSANWSKSLIDIARKIANK